LISAGALLQNPLGELIALPQSLWLDFGDPTSKERAGKKRKKEKSEKV